MNNTKIMFYGFLLFFAVSVGGNFAEGYSEGTATATVLATLFLVGFTSQKMNISEKCMGNPIYVTVASILILLSIGGGTFITNAASVGIAEIFKRPGAFAEGFIAYSQSLLKGLGVVKESIENGDPNQLTGAGSKSIPWVFGAIGSLLLITPLIWKAVPINLINGVKKTCAWLLGIAFFMGFIIFYLEKKQFAAWQSTKRLIEDHELETTMAGIVIVLGIFFLNLIGFRSKRVPA